MANVKHSNQIKSHQNEILNFITNNQTNHLRLNILNSKNNLGVGTRASNKGAHILAQIVTGWDDGMPDYDKKAYYITFNQYENIHGYLSFVLRHDLVKYWLENDTSDVYVMFISDVDDSIYEVPVDKIKEYYKNNDKKNICVMHSMFEDVIFVLDSTLYTKAAKQNHNEYVYKQYIDENGYDTKHDFNPAYFQPQFIGNFTYAQFRNRTNVKVYQYYAKSGEFINEKTFRSINELYALLVKKGAYSKSCKTLRRDIAAGKLIQLDNDIVVYMTTNLNLPHDELNLIAKQHEVTNVLYNESEPESEENTPTITYTEQVADKSYIQDEEAVTEIVNSFDEQLEIHDDDIEEEIQSLGTSDEAKKRYDSYQRFIEKLKQDDNKVEELLHIRETI